MREAGATFREIGEALGIHTSRARQIWNQTHVKAFEPPPVVRYFAETQDLEGVAFYLRRRQRSAKK
jgi:hypothetical protein